jgi:hypothetical protein
MVGSPRSADRVAASVANSNAAVLEMMEAMKIQMEQMDQRLRAISDKEEEVKRKLIELDNKSDGKRSGSGLSGLGGVSGVSDVRHTSGGGMEQWADDDDETDQQLPRRSPVVEIDQEWVLKGIEGIADQSIKSILAISPPDGRPWGGFGECRTAKRFLIRVNRMVDTWTLSVKSGWMYFIMRCLGELHREELERFLSEHHPHQLRAVSSQTLKISSEWFMGKFQVTNQLDVLLDSAEQLKQGGPVENYYEKFVQTQQELMVNGCVYPMHVWRRTFVKGLANNYRLKVNETFSDILSVEELFGKLLKWERDGGITPDGRVEAVQSKQKYPVRSVVNRTVTTSGHPSNSPFSIWLQAQGYVAVIRGDEFRKVKNLTGVTVWQNITKNQSRLICLGFSGKTEADAFARREGVIIREFENRSKNSSATS